MPEPESGEDRKGFIARCMGDPEALASFPRADQRHAFCSSQFSAKEASPAVATGEPSVIERSLCVRCGKPVLLVGDASSCPDCDEPVQAGAVGSYSNAGSVAEWVKGKKRQKEAAGPDMVEAFREAGLLRGDVLDFGAGEAEHEFAKWDPYVPCDEHALCRDYDVVVLSRVLDELPVPMRIQTLAAARGVLREGGSILVAARMPDLEEEDVANLGLGYSDGWATGRAYQSGWAGDEWHQFFTDQQWDVAELEAPEGMLAFELGRKALSDPATQDEGEVGKTEDDVQRGQPSYGALEESALADGLAFAKRWRGPVDLGRSGS